MARRQRQMCIRDSSGETQAELVARALDEGFDAARFDAELTALDHRHDPNGAM